MKLDDWIEDGLFGVGINSGNRCRKMLELLTSTKSAREIYKILAIGWSSCDSVSTKQQSEILRTLRKTRKESPEAGFLDVMEESDRVWWNGCRDTAPIKVYRGCDADRVLAMSWTLNLEVATDFAKGHRGIVVPNPVIASIYIQWDDVLFATNEREEEEVLLDFSGFEPTIAACGR